MTRLTKDNTDETITKESEATTIPPAALAFPHWAAIGTGNVSLGARGDLRDWEIFNQPGERRDDSADLLRAALQARTGMSSAGYAC